MPCSRRSRPGGDFLARVPRLRAGSPRHARLRHGLRIAVASRACRHVAACHPRERRRPSTKQARQEGRRTLDQPAAIEALVIRPGQGRARAARPAAHQDAERTRRQRAADAAPVARRSGHGLVRRRHAQRDHGMHDRIFTAGRHCDPPNSRRFACMLAAPARTRGAGVLLLARSISTLGGHGHAGGQAAGQERGGSRRTRARGARPGALGPRA